jgi:hypothetical protein
MANGLFLFGVYLYYRSRYFIIMVLCTGCNREFSASGYTTHVARTGTSFCCAVYNSRLAFLVDCNVDNDIDMDHTGSWTFEDDLFGEYEEGNFDWPKDEETGDNLEDDDSDTEDNDNSDTEDGDTDSNDPGIELAITTHMLSPPLFANTPSNQASDTPGAPPLSEAQSVQPCAPLQLTQPAQPQTPREPDYVIKPFPGGAAGMPLESSTVHQSNFKKYQQHLNSDDVYAPFISQIDWEIAWWIKIRGPSSSAVNELLKIDGVIYLFYCFSQYVIT